MHEWAYGDEGRRTVCGLDQMYDRLLAVSDLSRAPREQWCRNCERLRAVAGASSRPVAAASASEPEASPSPGGRELGERGELSERERAILEHATAWRSRWPLHRNHFCADAAHEDLPAIRALVSRGLMHVSREPSSLSGGDTVYCVTAIGIAALKRKGRGPAVVDVAGEAAGEATNQAE